MEEVEKKEVEEVETIEEEKQDLGWGQQEGREAKELPREELVPIAQLLAKHNIFDVDASHSFEECADAAVRLGTLSQVERHGMAALVESGRRSDRFMSATLWPNLAHVLGVSGWYAPATDYSPRTHGTWHDESGRFSLAVCLQPLVTTRWERLKDLGNEALKAGEPEVALTWYERAATLCSGPADYVETFFATLQERKERKGRRAAKRLVEKIEAITPHLRRQMPDAPAILEIERDEQAVQSGAPMHAYEPNLPLATCLANKAAAELECARRIKKVSDGYMRDHLLQSAMEAAVKATLMCPEYIKGYYRLKQVLTAMATSSPNGEEERNQAERISKMIAFYEQIGPSLPWSGMTCVLTGWLTWHEYARAYEPAYVAHELRLLKHEILKEANAQTKVNVTVTGDPQRGGVTRTAAEKPPSALSLVVLASLVAVHGGQWLLLSVEVSAKGLDGANVDGMRHDGLSFVPVDSANGKLVEQTPPRGSKAALERFVAPLARFLHRLRLEGLEAGQVELGQALWHEVERVQRGLLGEGGGSGDASVAPFAGIRVTAAPVPEPAAAEGGQGGALPMETEEEEEEKQDLGWPHQQRGPTIGWDALEAEKALYESEVPPESHMPHAPASQEYSRVRMDE